MNNVMIGSVGYGIGATRKPKVKSVEIWGKRWNDKTYGNTYHAVRVYVNDELVGTSPIRYGYGDSYIQTAEEILNKAGYFKRKDPREPLWRYTQDRKIKLKKYATDVKTKRELKDFAA
jgi:hypothetical protein